MYMPNQALIACGIAALSALSTAISTNAPDAVYPSWRVRYADRPASSDREPDALIMTYPWMRAMLDAASLPHVDWSWVYIDLLTRAGTMYDSSVMTGSFSRSLETMVVELMFRGYDLDWPAAEGEVVPARLPMSELIWQSFAELELVGKVEEVEVSPTGELSAASCPPQAGVVGLKWILMPHVANKLSKAVMEEALKDAEVDEEVKVSARHPLWEELAGTDNVRPFLHLLKDHHRTLGDVSLVKIVLSRRSIKDRIFLSMALGMGRSG
ncbi:hypothetical protein K402DRAFT_464631 [Aulographum hederae CBS 113979]|uniref:Uncharacterized protein n=1 Tax=Aulographum hederae CBS 113979 TaxID=1176131 RepID=A0A6G1GWM1_9PEZI|nr:hypothetical protein K402DRAFT_464631 [Aulographum hederae CBS 113979]